MLINFIFSRRLTETKSFNRSDNAPWRRSFISTTQTQPTNVPKGNLKFIKHYWLK